MLLSEHVLRSTRGRCTINRRCRVPYSRCNPGALDPYYIKPINNEIVWFESCINNQSVSLYRCILYSDIDSCTGMCICTLHALTYSVKYVRTYDTRQTYPGNDPKMMRSALVFHDISVQLVGKIMLVEDQGSLRT